jgi:DNA ligase (NAD+)
VASAPLTVTSQIIQAKSKYKKNWLDKKIFAKYPTNGIVVKINSRKLQLLREKSLSQNNEWQYAIEK